MDWLPNSLLFLVIFPKCNFSVDPDRGKKACTAITDTNRSVPSQNVYSLCIWEGTAGLGKALEVTGAVAEGGRAGSCCICPLIPGPLEILGSLREPAQR